MTFAGDGGQAVVDCYRLDLSRYDPQDLALLDQGERERAARFHFDRDRIRFIAAHAQARQLIGSRLGIDPARLRFATTALGKPILADQAAAALAFNLTHSGAVGYLASAPFGVGIDVELDRPFDDLQPLIDDYCSPAEIAALAALPAAALGAAFLGVWTRKEAALKAWGTGIGAVPLAALHVGLAESAAAPEPAQESLPGIFHEGIAYPSLRLLTLSLEGEVLSVAAACSVPLTVRMAAARPTPR
jgi:phosphopantetheinyl transferase